MARMKVKDMSRRQQKAVFANMTDDKYLRKLENAEDYRARMAYLKHKHDLAESAEDKLFDVWNNKKLTYRQKMTKVGEIKADAKKRLERYQKEERATGTVSKIRKENVRRFEKEYGIGKVGNKKRVSLDELEKGAKIEYKEHKGEGRFSMANARNIAARNLKKDKKYYSVSAVYNRKPPVKKSIFLVRFLNKKTKRRDFKEISAENRKDARKILLSQKKDVGVISINKKTPQAFLLEKKLAKRKTKIRKLPRDKLYKDAYDTKSEAEDIKYYLEGEGKKDVYIFKDESGTWNIAYNEANEE